MLIIYIIKTRYFITLVIKFEQCHEAAMLNAQVNSTKIPFITLFIAASVLTVQQSLNISHICVILMYHDIMNVITVFKTRNLCSVQYTHNNIIKTMITVISKEQSQKTLAPRTQ